MYKIQNEDILQEKLNLLKSFRIFSPGVIQKFESILRTGSDKDIFRINPYSLSEGNTTLLNENIDLLLLSTKIGIVKMNWELICPTCGQIVKSFESLSNLEVIYTCSLCSLETRANLDDYIAVNFSVLPLIRENSYYEPMNLPIREHCLGYHYSPLGYFPDGANFISEMERVITDAFYFLPEENKELELSLTGEMVGVHDYNSHRNFFILLENEIAGQAQELEGILTTTNFVASTNQLQRGKVKLKLQNKSSHIGAIAILQIPFGFITRGKLNFKPFLTGKELLNNQTFRDQFRNEVIRDNEGISISNLTFLFTDLKGSTEMYERLGDLNAFTLVRQHFDSLTSVINRHNGAVVKTIGDAIMATFLQPVDAVLAAIAMHLEIKNFNVENHTEDFLLKIGIHTGTAIAVTLNGRLDYFGQAVNMASRVQSYARTNEICITEEVLENEHVKAAISFFTLVSEKANLKGISREVLVYRITYLNYSR